MTSACTICAKHRGSGPLVSPLIFEDDLVVVSHRPLSQGTAVPGYLFVETRRHVRSLSLMTEREALAVSRAVWCISRVLEAELFPESVFSAIVGRSVSHFHQHVFVRPFGTPDSVAWNDVDSWDSAPRVDEDELNRLCHRLRTRFEARY